MYDTASGEGLVCVNGRCISNKKKQKFKVHNEYEMGLHGSNRRGTGRKGPPSRRKRIRPGQRHNGIPMNPYENLDEQDDNDLFDYGEEMYDDFDEFEMDEDHYTDGKVYNASGNKP